MQLIVTSELEEDNLWLKNLTNDLSERETAQKLLMELMKDELEEREIRGEIKSLVEICMEFGVSREDIVAKLIRKFELTKEKAEEVYGKYAGEMGMVFSGDSFKRNL